ncbi:hypothetical protein G7B40_005540 [Aetokthonos hydrillicola Thurmond2011]|jgi:hypothetical protein|uniref:Uncharacterized protein n=1 Tax=Aetokthonos hydrillicola Thurmond2011 TaxID=2712845 RepID=A0AAP5M6E5_9CYAN|nr:hypothetical protein [Aetokthonos hydrillicola]MBO3457293.1 hypothetical protein [Aetokthonos hydrillicola CCALA 1050]MBW4586638.1 hypothetical protein [Aetokthonos hydrillicola CCALA 1050]MDR9894035.1 hypothetical protein [Aetokthonos hydrillicola Thurmond2011]
MEKKRKNITIDNAYSSYQYTAKIDSSDPDQQKIWDKINKKFSALFKSAQNFAMKLARR